MEYYMYRGLTGIAIMPVQYIPLLGGLTWYQ